ncbi:MAG: hypothetical protein HN929_03660 [Chloroflexi bacterium]|jgi:hypothetical protein|nr:hypothetical protein [Chloroflexota bacterium]
MLRDMLKKTAAIALGLMFTVATANTVFAQGGTPDPDPAATPDLGPMTKWEKALFDSTISGHERLDAVEARVSALERRVTNNRSLIDRGMVADMVQTRAFATEAEATHFLGILDDAGLSDVDVKEVTTRTTVPVSGNLAALIAVLNTDEARAQLIMALGLPTVINAAIDAKLDAAVSEIEAKLDAIDVDSVEQVREALNDADLVQQLATAVVSSLSEANRDTLMNKLGSEIDLAIEGSLIGYATVDDAEALARGLYDKVVLAIEQVDRASRAADRAIGTHLGRYSDPKESKERQAASSSATSITDSARGSVSVDTFDDVMAALSATP